MPTAWVDSIRHTLATLSPELSADRMVREYVEHFYIPASRAEDELTRDHYQAARDLAAWKQRTAIGWPDVSVVGVESGGLGAIPEVGNRLQVRVDVTLGRLKPSDVAVEVIFGRSRDDELTNVQAHELDAVDDSADLAGVTHFAGVIPLEQSGAFGYNVRIVPRNRLLASSAELGLIRVLEQHG